LKQLKLLDDLDFSSQWASYKLKTRRQGVRRIVHELKGYGVEEKTAQKAIQSVLAEESEPAAAEKALGLYLSRHGMPETLRASRRTLGYLNRMGFSQEAVRHALDIHKIEITYNQSETDETG